MFSEKCDCDESFFMMKILTERILPMKILLTGVTLFCLGIVGCDSGVTTEPVQTSDSALAGKDSGIVTLSTISTRLEEPAFGSVDAINDVVAPESGTIIDVASERLTIAGNYVDAERGEAAAGVIVVIGGQPFEAVYGGDRPDIAQALNNPKYLKSQFYLDIPRTEIPKGTHEVRIRAVASDRSGYYESDWFANISMQ